MEVSKLNIDDHIALTEFFVEKFYFSYTSLNKLIYSPQLFYKHYILKQKDDESSPALIQGKLIHCLSLDDASFEKQFILLPGNLPSENPRKIVESVFKHYRDQEGDTSPCLEDYTDVILEILRQINLHQSLKTDEQRLEKILSDQNKEYFDFLIKAQGRDVVDLETYDYCTSVAEQIKSHSEVSTLLGINSDESIQVYNELPLATSLKDFSFGIKGIVDNLKIDLENKTIWINDLKTTSKTLSDFPETVEFYNLWLQAALYKQMVTQVFIRENNLAPEEWTINFTFVVIDKYRQIYPFQVSPHTMVQWEEKAFLKLHEAEWHIANRRFDLPYKFLMSQIFL